jgi:peroxiredoxin (alkyl hydroperoxide reductase subunit C)
MQFPSSPTPRLLARHASVLLPQGIRELALCPNPFILQIPLRLLFACTPKSLHYNFVKMETGNTSVSVGASVPNFELETYNPAEGDFGKLSLAEIKAAGKWTILVFYPADFTFVCPTELADLADKHDALAKLGATVISVSTDTKFAHLAWRNSERLLKDVKYAMAADPTGAVSRLFGVYDPASGLALRGTFIINPSGQLVSSEVNFYNVGRDADELLRKLQANVHLLANPTEACPAKWTPGAKTLHPGKDIVGNVAAALGR